MVGTARSAFAHPTALRSIQREAGRVSAQIRRRVERLAIDRAIAVFARKRWIPDVRRVSVVHELALARKHFGAGVEPRAPGDVDARLTLLIDHVGTVRAVIRTASVIVSPWLVGPALPLGIG